MDLTIMVANEQKVKEIRCSMVSIQIHELELQIGLYTLTFEEMDMMLGTEHDSMLLHSKKRICC